MNSGSGRVSGFTTFWAFLGDDLSVFLTCGVLISLAESLGTKPDPDLPKISIFKICKLFFNLTANALYLKMSEFFSLQVEGEVRIFRSWGGGSEGWKLSGIFSECKIYTN